MRILIALSLALFLGCESGKLPLQQSTASLTIGPGLRTTDATATEYPVVGPSVVPDSICRAPIFVFASDHVGGAASWFGILTVRRTGEAVVQGIGTLTKLATLGGATWTATPLYTASDVRVTVSGGIGQTVDWAFTNDDAFCMTGAFGG